jgi:hypothetical protein
MKLPTQTQNPKGLHQRYIVSKTSGEPVDPRAEYFILRLDRHGKDLAHINACRKAVLMYAYEMEHILPELSADIYRRYNRSVLPPKKKLLTHE